MAIDWANIGSGGLGGIVKAIPLAGIMKSMLLMLGMALLSYIGYLMSIKKGRKYAECVVEDPNGHITQDTIMWKQDKKGVFFTFKKLKYRIAQIPLQDLKPLDKKRKFIYLYLAQTKGRYAFVYPVKVMPEYEVEEEQEVHKETGEKVIEKVIKKAGLPKLDLNVINEFIDNEGFLTFKYKLSQNPAVMMTAIILAGVVAGIIMYIAR